jgi:hypothetical protein
VHLRNPVEHHGGRGTAFEVYFIFIVMTIIRPEGQREGGSVQLPAPPLAAGSP